MAAAPTDEANLQSRISKSPHCTLSGYLLNVKVFGDAPLFNMELYSLFEFTAVGHSTRKRFSDSQENECHQIKKVQLSTRSKTLMKRYLYCNALLF